MLLIAIGCTPRISLASLKNGNKLDAKNKVSDLFEKVAEKFEAIGDKELALA